MKLPTTPTQWALLILGGALVAFPLMALLLQRSGYFLPRIELDAGVVVSCDLKKPERLIIHTQIPGKANSEADYKIKNWMPCLPDENFKIIRSHGSWAACYPNFPDLCSGLAK